MLKNKAPKLIHNCPYSGDWDLKNFTLNLDLIDRATMMMPQGTYRADFSFYVGDIKAFNFTGSAEIKSPLKESFG